MKIGLIPAAGMARRLGISTPKELLRFGGKAVIEYSIDNLIEADVDSIIIVIREGKEAIKAHVEEKYPNHQIEFVYQSGYIGNLIDAIKTSYDAIKGHDVCFSMGDTVVRPNPFRINTTKELMLLCFLAKADEWKNFGVLDVSGRRLVDKPAEFVSNVCWGALIWKPLFTEKIMQSDNFPAVINQVDWEHTINIEEYIDIGTGKLLEQ